MVKWWSLGFSQKWATIAIPHACTQACFQSFLLLSGSRHIPTLSQRNVVCLYLVADSRSGSTWKALGGRIYNITEAAHPLLKPPARDRGRRGEKRKKEKLLTLGEFKMPVLACSASFAFCLLFLSPSHFLPMRKLSFPVRFPQLSYLPRATCKHPGYNSKNLLALTALSLFTRTILLTTVM